MTRRDTWAAICPPPAEKLPVYMDLNVRTVIDHLLIEEKTKREADAYRTDPVDFPCPPGDLLGKNERHWRELDADRA